MPDALAGIADTLRGTAPPAMPTKAEATAARLGRAAAVLRATGDAELADVAGAFEQWLACGGDLARMLGAKAARGKRNELPHNAAARAALRAGLRELQAKLELPADDRAAARGLSFVLRRQPVLQVILRAETGVDAVPTSRNGLFSVLRAGES